MARLPLPSALLAGSLLSALLPAAAAQCQLGTFQPALSEDRDFFGSALDVDADRAVIGATDSGLFGAERAWAFRRTPSGWIEDGELVPNEDVTNQLFGWAVAIDGDVALVSARLDDQVAFSAGAVYVFERSASGWGQTQKLVDAAGQQGDQFGYELGLDGNVAWIHSFLDESASGDLGSIHVFERGGAGFVPTQVIEPPGGLASFSLDGERALVGEDAGDVRLYVPAPGGWVATDIVLTHPSGAPVTEPRLSGSRAVLRALPPDTTGLVFDEGPNGWTLTAELPGPSLVLGSLLSWTLERDVAAVGYRLLPFDPGTGAVRVFREQAGGWEQVAELTAGPGPVPNVDLFGTPLALSDGEVLAAEPRYFDAELRGRVHVFDVDELCGVPRELSLAAGGAQVFALNAGPSLAGELYLLLGSATGTAPGIGVDGLTIPLNPGAYYLTLLLNPNSSIAGSLGSLDADGRGAATLALPAGLSPALAGVELHHAFVTLDLATLAVEHASNPERLGLLP